MQAWYSATDLTALTGASRATIRKWVELGILPHATIRDGCRLYYTNDHLRRIREIRQLQDNNRTMADLVDYFNPLPEDDDE